MAKSMSGCGTALGLIFFLFAGCVFWSAFIREPDLNSSSTPAPSSKPISTEETVHQESQAPSVPTAQAAPVEKTLAPVPPPTLAEQLVDAEASMREAMAKRQRAADAKSDDYANTDEEVKAIAQEVRSLREQIKKEAREKELRRKTAEMAMQKMREDLQKPIGRLEVGAAGMFSPTLEITQILGPTEAIATYGADLTFVWLSGWSTEDKVDGSRITLPKPVIVAGTKQYTTVLGGTKTVFVLKPAMPD